MPIPWASNSSVIVNRECSPPLSGSIAPLAVAMTGNRALPRIVQVRGGLYSVISSVEGSLRGPIRRVTAAVDHTPSGPSPTGLAEMTFACHSGKWEKLVA